MHVVVRILFWLSLAGTAIALIAPIATDGGASWGEAQPVALFGVAMCLILAVASARRVPSNIAADPVATARRRRSSGIAYATALIVVLAPAAFYAGSQATEQRDRASSDASSARLRGEELGFGRGFGRGPSADSLEADAEVAHVGEITAYITLGAAGIAFIGLLTAAARRIPRPQAVQPAFRSSGAPYQAAVMAPYQQPYAHGGSPGDFRGQLG